MDKRRGVNLRKITKKDIELIETINMVFNFKVSEEKISGKLERNYLTNKEDAQAAFAYGFYNFLVTSKVKNSAVGSERIEIIFNAYNDALQIESEYWIIQMFKAVLLLSLPEVMRSDDALVETLNKMIESQDKEEEKETYFVLPYIIYADYEFTCNNRAEVLKQIELAETKVKKGTIHFKNINPYFCMPFKDFLKRLARSNENEIADRVLELGKIFFPTEEMFQNGVGKILL